MEIKVSDLKNHLTMAPEKSSEAFEHLVYLVHKYQRAAQRQGTSSTKTRSEVRGGGAKPYKQKGTGNARRGTNRTPLRRGGAVIFGPKPRSFKHSLNGKLVGKVFRSAFGLKEKAIKVVDLKGLKAVKTSDVDSLLKGLGRKGVEKVMYICPSEGDVVSRAFRNLENAVAVSSKSIPLVDFLNSEVILVSQESVAAIKGSYLR